MQNVKEFKLELLNWYLNNKRDLPWRQTNDPYKIWISEAMLQQTQVKTVIPYYQRFIEKFPTVKDLADADQQKILKMWEGLGYYSRARNLHKAAKMIVEEFFSKVPYILDEIKTLPGVGDYISAAVLSIAFQFPIAVVDGNVKRVLARLYCLDEPVNDSKNKKIFKQHAEKLLNRENPGDHNQAMMELGALICTPKNPQCNICQVTDNCQSFKKEKVDQYPKRITKAKTPLYHISIGVIYKDGKMLITKREDDGLLGGLWEFPGGKREPKETAEDACIREIKEETGLTVTIEKYLTKVKHAYTHFRISIDVFICNYISGDIFLNGPVDFRWITKDEISDYPFPTSNHKFMGLL
ncbi:A/G-specific adenine glycosylase [Methanococcoides sp. SA1]|nr:A/G-specific adenine glycosylase [Methanococcoides sp. SA1]